MIEFITDGSYVQLKDNEGLKERLHNTSTAFSWSISDTGVINFIVDGMKYENVPIADIYFDGVVCASHADFVTNIQGLFTNLAGGGGASLLKVATYTLTDSQIKNLPATYVRLLTPTEGKINIAVSISFITDFVTAYADCAVADQQLLFGYGTYPNDATIQFIMNTGDNSYLNTLLTKTVPSVGKITPQSLISELGYGIFNDYTSNPLTWYQEGIFIKAFTLADALFTGGNAANTMKITISYIEVDI